MRAKENIYGQGTGYMLDRHAASHSPNDEIETSASSGLEEQTLGREGKCVVSGQTAADQGCGKDSCKVSRGLPSPRHMPRRLHRLGTVSQGWGTFFLPRAVWVFITHFVGHTE